MKYYIIIVVLCICMVTGCKKDNSKSDVATDMSVTEKMESGEDNENMTLITVDEFKEEYNLSDEDIEGYDVEGMIKEYSLTREDFELWNLYERMKLDAEAGIRYGYNLDTIIQKKCRTATAEDDFSRARYFVLEVETYGDTDGDCYTKNIVIDPESDMAYYDASKKDFSNCKKVINLSDEQMNQIKNDIDRMQLANWESDTLTAPSYVPGEYAWKLYIVMDDTDTIKYSGNIPGKELEQPIDDIIELLEEN